MRKQIAAANWKMNLSYQAGEKLLDEILKEAIPMAAHQHTIFAVPFPYLLMARSEVAEDVNYHVAAQNCYHQASGAFTGEVSAEMLHSIGVNYCIIGHSERREYFNENHEQLAAKLSLCFQHYITPIFCCGEPLASRESGGHEAFVRRQLEESLFHLDKQQFAQLIIAYEPIWAIGTGKTATTAQAQEMHAFIRSVLAGQYGELAASVPILYGGSVKSSNAAELFACPDVDGGLVGGASLVAADFTAIIRALKK